jgi:hypothetical protein
MQLTAWPDEFVDGLVELGFYVIRFDNRDAACRPSSNRPARRTWAWPG